MDTYVDKYSGQLVNKDMTNYCVSSKKKFNLWNYRYKNKYIILINFICKYSNNLLVINNIISINNYQYFVILY